MADRLSPGDAIWLLIERPDEPTDAGGLTVYDGEPLDIDRPVQENLWMCQLVPRPRPRAADGPPPDPVRDGGARPRPANARGRAACAALPRPVHAVQRAPDGVSPVRGDADHADRPAGRAPGVRRDDQRRRPGGHL